MFTALEAYNKMKSKEKEPIIFFFETCELFIFHKNGNGFECIDKATGDEKYLWMHEYHNLLEKKEVRDVYLPQIFENLKEEYINHPDELTLSEIYAACWNHLLWYERNGKEFCGEDMAFYNEQLERYRKLEQYFYDIIIEVITDEINPADNKGQTDRFYTLKPFMVQNGYTVSMNDTAWVKI